MLEVKNLSIHYDNKQIVKNVSFDANKGDIVVFLGRTGCGKTSIFNSIVNLIDFVGSILFDNKKIVNKDMNIAVSTQHYDLYNFKTVYENITLGLKLKGKSLEDKEILYLLEKFNLKEYKNKYPNELSGGQKQTVSLIRSLVMHPELFLLDEAFSALDSFSREFAQNFLCEYLKDKKCVTLLITHSIDEALYVGDKIYIFGDNPSTIQHKINSISGLDRNSEEFLKKHVEIRKIFNL